LCAGKPDICPRKVYLQAKNVLIYIYLEKEYVVVNGHRNNGRVV
jgi:hypothetical protein